MSNKVLVAGLGKSGISAAKLLLSAGGEVLLYDGNENLNEEDILSKFEEEYISRISLKFGELSKSDIVNISICVISPGISLDSPFVSLLDDNNIQIWSEIQLAYKMSKGKLIAITGTNGKTTTTALTGQIVAKHFESSFVVGNIGIPYTDIANETTEDSVTVLETSSFQLETIIDFKPNISAILNITPDHLNRHHTMENYISIKEDIGLNQSEEDFMILNYDDEVLREFGQSDKCRARKIYFSSTNKLEEGLYLVGKDIYLKKEGKETRLFNVDELNILGKHNYENVMAAIAMTMCLNIPMETIISACKEFKAVEHRIEFVTKKSGVSYYNDSKGTNPDAAIQAIKAMPGPILLIAGGYDKGSDYDEWIETFDKKVKHLILIGQTRDAIASCARKHGFSNIMYASDMEEAVMVCASYAVSGDYVLLSPACASWGMFKDYEERGRIFKDLVNRL